MYEKKCLYSFLIQQRPSAIQKRVICRFFGQPDKILPVGKIKQKISRAINHTTVMLRSNTIRHRHSPLRKALLLTIH